MRSYMWAIEVSAANVANRLFGRERVRHNGNGLQACTALSHGPRVKMIMFRIQRSGYERRHAAKILVDNYSTTSSVLSL